MKIDTQRIHSQFITTLIHFISQLIHLGLAILFTTEWHDLTAACPPLGHALTAVFGALTAIYGALSTAKGYALLTNFCDEPWAKRTLSILSMVTSSTSAFLACAALILLELEVSGNLTFCGISSDQTPVLPSRIFLVVSVLLNIILFTASLFLHWRQGRVDALDRDLAPTFVSSFSSFPTPSAPPLSNPSTYRLDPTARFHSPHYILSQYPTK
ncbi:hypothetical protein PRIPAC_71248 [Pristionchus pacificus]|uniref:Uncharacterized protein n=1 Tax=Pristionchus pacificus TaxID=54126 RepID=A0A2A6CZY2_PRIPA|nr:hypothetical protein PRIPAC_71248 [Pristionchus pacificus]|eukprot:PDM83725.1 hypothetical protein PRIPAC_30212 [Pristionchus pacificus]